jgi:hypothetical protein
MAAPQDREGVRIFLVFVAYLSNSSQMLEGIEGATSIMDDIFVAG